jgi:hypothetical protein
MWQVMSGPLSLGEHLQTEQVVICLCNPLESQRYCGRVAQLGEHLLCKQGVAGSIPATSTNISLPFKHLLIWPLRDFRNLGPFGSNKKLLHFFDRLALLFRNRVQINLPCDFRRCVA